MTSGTLALIGLGGMGGGVAGCLIEAGHPLVVHNRTAAKATALLQAGAEWAPTPGDAAAAADVVLISLSDEAAVEQILFGEAAPRLRPGTTVVEMTTVSPEYARASAERLAAIGVRRVEACLIGNPQMARAGELRVFAGGEAEHVAEVRPVLAVLAKQGVLHLGPTGLASSLKLAFNLLLGVQTAGLAEAVAFAEGAGIDRDQFLTAIQNSGWRSPVLSFRAEFMRNRSYRPAAFRAQLMAKDLRLATKEAAEHGLTLPVTESAALRFADVVDSGAGDDDAAVIVEMSPANDTRGAAPSEKNGAVR